MRDEELYARSVVTLLAALEVCARGSAGAALERSPGVAAAVFPTEPERSFYNNAVFERGLDRSQRAAAVDAMEAAYGAAGIGAYAGWVHETDAGMRSELARRGYAVAESTRAMAMALHEVACTPPADLAPATWTEYVAVLTALGAPAGTLAGVDPSTFQVLVARIDGEPVAAALALDHDGDCGVFNVATIERARRRGLATALTARLLRDAAARGCTTASLQSTPAAERLYGALGFRDLGRILEYVRPPLSGP
jgi:ribosomal protein S18 acetylase RimI-like enzyme